MPPRRHFDSTVIMGSQFKVITAPARDLDQRMSDAFAKVDTISTNLIGNISTLQDIIVLMEKTTLEPQNRSSGMPTSAISSVRRVYPKGFPLKTLEAFVAFSEQEDLQRYNELVQWLAQCDGVDLTAVINTMIKHTLKGDLPNHLAWTTNIKDSKYIKACRAAVNLMIQQGKFHNQSPITGADGNFAAAVRAALKSAKARLKRQSQKNN